MFALEEIDVTTLTVSTKSRNELVDITGGVRDFVRDAAAKSGAVLVFCPHTTAAITINENADPDVPADIVLGLGKIAPILAEFRHSEGNSDSHIKSSLVGCSELVTIEDGKLGLGTWQGIFFCEFDGPRKRKVHLTLLASA
ncbi:secondary thiamine-phosphate synthase enzyme YjbQ [bacterium]|nr:secondary thiamine-phosphate synthase enzyme YjbQ [bacterium]